MWAKIAFCGSRISHAESRLAPTIGGLLVAAVFRVGIEWRHAKVSAASIVSRISAVHIRDRSSMLALIVCEGVGKI